MRSSLLFSLILLVSFTGYGQDTINKINISGKKEGFWRKKDNNGNKIYEGRFHDGIPYGEFKYYFPGGNLQAVNLVSQNGSHVHTVTYFKNGKKNAEGNYINEKRDSLWRFFSEVDAALVSEELYKEGKKEGIALDYYPGEGKSELTTWKNGIKQGPWETYFPDGKIKLKCNYRNDQKDGPIKVYFVSGKIMMSGQYLNGVPIGQWIYYKEKGGILKKELYDKGRVVKVDSTQNGRQ
jgi:antitoxin component YwqK of YwqJK toxin-antitoxin module